MINEINKNELNK